MSMNPMSFTTPDFGPATPEIFLLAMACVVLVVDVFLPERRRLWTYYLAQASLLLTAWLTFADYSGAEKAVTLGGTFVKDAMGDVLKGFVYLAVFVVFLYARDYLQERKLFKGEFYLLGLFATLGMMVMISAHSLLTVYLGLELLALSLYAMVAFSRDDRIASEAAMKYFVLGALASGMLLYGMSMIYGATGSLDIAQVGEAVRALVAGSEAGELGQGTEALLVFGLVFVVVGIAFKLGAVPFHMWAPDIYHGAPTAVTVFIGSAPKLAAFAMIMRLLAEALGGLHGHWQDMLVLLAIASMAVGNVIAIAQTNIKRMLAYSTIAHVGFILLGVLAGTEEGYAAAMFYVIVYSITTLGGFGMVLLLSRQGFEADRLDDFRGLNERSPWFAFMMLIIMFSNAGVPPTVGFLAKWGVLRAVINVDMVWLAVVAVVFAIIGAFYYLRVIRLMYFDKPTDPLPLISSADMRLVLSANGLAVLLLGIFPGSLMALCLSTFTG
jgi:NADH-quinone oxidoreductase subunit N